MLFYIVSFKHPLLQILWFTDIKVCSYAGDMNLNRKDEKKYVEIKENDFLGNKMVKTFF